MAASGLCVEIPDIDACFWQRESRTQVGAIPALSEGKGTERSQ